MNQHAEKIIRAALADAMPNSAVRTALTKIEFNPDGKLIVIAAGKAAWSMANAACEFLGSRIHSGIVITKYGHSRGAIPPLQIYEAGHPVPDESGCRATDEVLKMVSGAQEDDEILFLLSGGGSALFEKPLVSLEEMSDITGQLLACGADITEINIIRKRLSAVKGGRFAKYCSPAKIYSIILSDVVGDRLDMIASGPACPDSSTCLQARTIAGKYHLRLSKEAEKFLNTETPKTLDNVTTYITGSVKQLCASASNVAESLGYEATVLTTSLSCEAKEAGAFLAAIARDHQQTKKSLCFLCGGETVVHLNGNGLGGRNQEIALAAAIGLQNCKDTCVFSFGSDGTDGPTDAAGGFADETTFGKMKEKGVDAVSALAANDSYHALKAADSLIFTGPTGTNVNDLSVILIKR